MLLQCVDRSLNEANGELVSNPSGGSGSDGGVLVMSVRRLTARMSQYDAASSRLSLLLRRQPNLLEEAEYDALLALDPRVLLFSPPTDILAGGAPKTVRVILMRYDSADDYEAAADAVQTSREWRDLDLVSEEECGAVLRLKDGGALSTIAASFPALPRLTEFVLGRVKERQESAYEEERARFGAFLGSVRGVEDAREYRALHDPDLRVTGTVFRDRKSLDEFAEGMINDQSAEYFNTFVTECHYVLSDRAR